MNDTEQLDENLVFDAETEALDAFVATPPAPVKRGVGWGVVLPLFLLAGAGGAVGGWALTQYVMPNYVPLPAAETPTAAKINLAPLTMRIETLEKKLSAQSSELSFLSSEVKSGAASVTVGGVDGVLDITPLMNRLNELEGRLDKVGNPTSKIMPSISDGTGTAIPADDFIETVENKLWVLEETMRQTLDSESSERETESSDFRAKIEILDKRINQLETDVITAKAQAANPEIIRETVLLPPFPREALLAAMTAPRDAGSQGWVNRTLKKHISVRNPQEVARANETLDAIEASVANHDYAAALSLIDAMPSDVRSVAGDWTQAVKTEIKTR